VDRRERKGRSGRTGAVDVEGKGMRLGCWCSYWRGAKRNGGRHKVLRDQHSWAPCCCFYLATRAHCMSETGRIETDDAGQRLDAVNRFEVGNGKRSRLVLVWDVARG
jgi:hypothetical protein